MVRINLVLSAKSDAHNVGLKVVAGMFHIGGYAEINIAFHLIQPILADDVVGLAFVGVIGRGVEAERAARVGRVTEVVRAEERLETVLLFAGKIDIQVVYFGQRAERGAAVVWDEVVLVLRDVADESHAPACRGTPMEVGLVVNKGRVVLAVCVERAKQVFAGFITDAVRQAKTSVPIAHVGVGAEQTGA